MNNNQIFAYITTEYQSKGIKWLRISPSTLIQNGVFILLYKDLSESCAFDYWFENSDKALNWAEKFYNIQPSDWKTKNELSDLGIEIFDES